jgi:hypothetical protein
MEERVRFISPTFLTLLVIWHCAPMLNEEQRRRLIGNDNAVLFFKDEGEPFNPINVHNMGGMTQCYVVVQPYDEETYRWVALIFEVDLLKGCIFPPSKHRQALWTFAHEGWRHLESRYQRLCARKM